MDTISAAAVARQLGTNVPRLLRTVERLGARPRRSPNGRIFFTDEQVAQLRHHLGVLPRIEGLTRPQVQVLAALSRAPLGLRSTRAVARAARLSPTAASRAIAVLREMGLVKLDREVVAEGRAREVEIVRANLTSPRWPRIAASLAVARLPEPQVKRPVPTGQVPTRLGHLFWNAAIAQLRVNEHGPYLAHRILVNNDIQALAWAARTLSAQAWRQGASTRGVGSSRRALAENLAQATEDRPI